MYSLVAIIWILGLILNIFLFSQRKKFLKNQVSSQNYLTAGILKNVFYNGKKHGRILFLLGFLGLITLFLPFLSPAVSILVALSIFLLPNLIIELFLPKIYKYDLILTAWITAFLYSILLGAGFLLLVGDLFFADTILLETPTQLSQQLAETPFNENLFTAIIVFFLAIILINGFWLIKALASTFLNRFQLKFNKKTSTFQLYNRFKKEIIAQIDFTKDYEYQEAYDYSLNFVGGLPSRQKVSVFIFKQQNKAIAITGPISLNKETPLVSSSETHIYDASLITAAEFAYQFYLYEDKFFEFAQMINKYKK